MAFFKGKQTGREDFEPRGGFFDRRIAFRQIALHLPIGKLNDPIAEILREIAIVRNDDDQMVFRELLQGGEDIEACLAIEGTSRFIGHGRGPQNRGQDVHSDHGGFWPLDGDQRRDGESRFECLFEFHLQTRAEHDRENHIW